MNGKMIESKKNQNQNQALRARDKLYARSPATHISRHAPQRATWGSADAHAAQAIRSFVGHVMALKWEMRPPQYWNGTDFHHGHSFPTKVVAYCATPMQRKVVLDTGW
jgi:hypothetical protein